jgi:large subunit ribosomal protein L15
MQLHDFNHKFKAEGKRKIRVGRGGKRGTTSGRGQKGQKSRSGHSIRPAQRDLIQRLPKLRGFAHKPTSAPVAVINVSKLESIFKKFASGKHNILVNKEALREAGFIGKNFHGNVKILSKGEITIPLTVQKLKVSASAKAKIEKAGGKVE